MILGAYIEGLMDCITAQVDQVCSVVFAPGAQVAWDYCAECGDSCGMAFISLTQSYLYSAFPFPDQEAKCHLPMAHQLEVGILRCIPMPDATGDLPSPAALNDAAYQMLRDQDALRCAIRDCQSGLVRLGTWTPLGPDGGCAGGAWTVYVDPHG